MRISDWSSDVCSSDLGGRGEGRADQGRFRRHRRAAPQHGGRIGADEIRFRPATLMRYSLVEKRGESIWSARHWLPERSEEHTSELQSLMRISYAVFCLKKKNTIIINSFSQ